MAELKEHIEEGRLAAADVAEHVNGRMFTEGDATVVEWYGPDAQVHSIAFVPEETLLSTAIREAL